MAPSAIRDTRLRHILSVGGRGAIAAGFALSAVLLADRTWTDPWYLQHAMSRSPSIEVAGLVEGLRYFIVTAELLGAALLLVPALAAFSALMLTLIAFGTLFSDVFVSGANPVWAACLFLGSAAIAGRRRREIIALWRIHTRWRRVCTLRRA